MGRPMDVPFRDGTYATPDPLNPDRVTLWWFINRRMIPWPHGQRWAPGPPVPPGDLTRKERAEWRQEWYEEHYFPWKDRVVDAIAADPLTAAELFNELVSPADRPTLADLTRPKPERKPKRHIRQATYGAAIRKAKRDKPTREAFIAASLARSGMTLDRIALVLDIPKTTAWRRLQAGKAEYGELLDQMSAASEAYKAAANHFGSATNMDGE